MTLDDVKARVSEIAAVITDDEQAHGREDELYLALLRHYAANGCPLAAEAIKTQALDFARWCA